MSKPKKSATPRRTIRKHPTKREATLMQHAMYHIGWMSAEANGLHATINQIRARPWDRIEFEDSNIRFTFDQAVATLLIYKLSAAVEDALNTLWLRRFPEVDPKRLRFEDKVAVVERLHNVDVTALRELWKQRNACAHTVTTMA